MSRELRVALEAVQSEVIDLRRQLEHTVDPALEREAAEAEQQCRALNTGVDAATGELERTQLTNRGLSVDLEAREADLRRAQQQRLRVGVLLSVVAVVVLGVGLAPFAAWRGWNAVIVAVGALSATAFGLLNPERKRAEVTAALPAPKTLLLSALAVLWSLGAGAMLFSSTRFENVGLIDLVGLHAYGPVPWLISLLLSVPVLVLVAASRREGHESLVMQITVVGCLSVLVLVAGWVFLEGNQDWCVRAGQLMLLGLALVFALFWVWGRPRIEGTLGLSSRPLEVTLFAMWFVAQAVLAGGIVSQWVSHRLAIEMIFERPQLVRFNEFIDAVLPVIESSQARHVRSLATIETDVLAIIVWSIALIRVVVAWRSKQLAPRGKLVLAVLLGVSALFFVLLRAPVLF